MQPRDSEVFLISGTTYAARQLSSGLVVTQRVVVAQDQVTAYAALAASEPGFVVIGHATLQDYKSTSATMIGVLAGAQADWPLLIAPGMDG